MDAAAQKPRYPWYVRIVVGSNPLYTLFRACVWATLIFVMFKYVLMGIKVHGASMEPSFVHGQVRVVNRVAYLWSSPKRGDIVAIRAPGLNAVLLKRIIALPGEKLTIRRGEIYINGKRLEEKYTKGVTNYRARDQEMEPHQYFVIGDNREISEAYLIFDYKIMGKLLF